MNVQKRPTYITSKAQDRRTARTRDRLSWSLIELIQEQGYDETTVQDVAARADVGRSTFYTHFDDKDDVFFQHFVGFMRAFGEKLAWSETTQRFTLPVRGLFEHLQEMQTLYHALSRAHRLDPMLKAARIVLSEVIVARMQTIQSEGNIRTTIPTPIAAQHMAGTLFNLLVWWMDHRQPHASQDMDDYFHRLAGQV